MIKYLNNTKLRNLFIYGKSELFFLFLGKREQKKFRNHYSIGSVLYNI